MRARVTLTHRCSNACVFCAQAGIDEPVGDPLGELERLSSDYKEVTFVGGEPTLSDALPRVIARARELGYTAIGIQSNADALAHRLPALKDAGLTDVHLSLHGHEAAIHDHHTGRPGSFDQIVATAAAARSLRLPVAVCTVITRSNFRVVSQISDTVARMGAKAWLCEFVATGGRAAPAFDRLVPRLALAVPHVLLAVTRARKFGVPSFVRGAPACLLGPYAPLAVRAPHAVHAAVCSTCPAATQCSGADPHYLTRFSADELRARAPFEHTPDHAQAQVFVGIGPIVAAELPGHLTATPARPRLPIV